MTLTNENTYGSQTGNYAATRGQYVHQADGNYQQLNNVKKRLIIHTKLYYKDLQSVELIFQDGLLKERKFIPK